MFAAAVTGLQLKVHLLRANVSNTSLRGCVCARRALTSGNGFETKVMRQKALTWDKNRNYFLGVWEHERGRSAISVVGLICHQMKIRRKKKRTHTRTRTVRARKMRNVMLHLDFGLWVWHKAYVLLCMRICDVRVPLLVSKGRHIIIEKCGWKLYLRFVCASTMGSDVTRARLLSLFSFPFLSFVRSFQKFRRNSIYSR